MDINNIVPGSPVQPSDLNRVSSNAYVKKGTAEAMLSVQPTIPTIVSTEDFYTYVNKIFTAIMGQRRMTAAQENSLSRAMVENMAEKIYTTRGVKLTDEGMDINRWLTLRNIDLSGLSKDDYSQLFTSIFETGTGLNLQNRDTLKDIQRSMIASMTKLTSYTVQFLADISDSDYLKTDKPSIRPLKITAGGQDRVDILLSCLTADATRGSGANKMKFELPALSAKIVGGKTVGTLKLKLPALKLMKPAELDHPHTPMLASIGIIDALIDPSVYGADKPLTYDQMLKYKFL